MALSKTHHVPASQFNSGATANVTGCAWSAGDKIIVFQWTNNTSVTLSAPTNANLTFTAVAAATIDTGTSESNFYTWEADAGSSQTGQTIVFNRSSGSGVHGGIVHVITGGPSGTANADVNRTESAFSKTVSANSIVLYGAADWNGTAAGRTIETGTGTATERVDDSDGTNYACWSGDWVGTSAGTFNFGVTSYTSWKVAHAVIEVLDAGGSATASPAAIAATVTMDATTTTAGAEAAPSEFAATVTIPQASASSGTPPADGLDLQDGFSLLLQDGSRLLLQSATAAGGDATASPAVIAASIAMEAVSASGTSDATPTPATILTSVALDAVTLSAGSTVAPTEILSTVTMDATTTTASGSTSPAEFAVIATLDAVTASGSGSAVATPGEIAAVVTMDAPTESASGSVSPSEILATVVMDAVTTQAGATATVTEIATVVVFDAVSASGGTSTTATPATIITSVALDAATVLASGTATPGEVVVLVSIPAVVAEGNGTYAPGYVVVVIKAESRAATIPAERRTYLIPPQPDTQVSVESRVYVIDAEARTLEVPDGG